MWREMEEANDFIMAASKGDMAAVKAGLIRGIPVNSKYRDLEFAGDMSGYTALMLAASGGHEAIVTDLIKAGADVNARRDGRTALYYAILWDRKEVIRLLKGAGATGDADQIRLTRRLLRAACKGFDKNEAKHRPLYPGVPRDLEEAESIAEVIAEGADVNWKDPAGYTPLMYAANLGLVENVKDLLKRGAEVNVVSSWDETALSMASKYDLKEVMQVLKEAGATDR